MSATVWRVWRRLGPEQRAAAVGAVLLVISTFGPFSFVEGATVLVAAAVLVLLKSRAEERAFHLPFGDGTVIAAAGAWCALLVVVRLFDRPLGQGLLALLCAAILVVAGLSERANRPPDDLPTERLDERPTDPLGDEGGSAASDPHGPVAPSPEPVEDAPTRRLPP